MTRDTSPTETTTDMPAILAAARALRDVLAFENRVLATFTFTDCASIALEKEYAIAAFNRALAAHGVAELPAEFARDLTSLVVENKRLLERALHVQGQVIACIARAAPKRIGATRSYDRHGIWANREAAIPMALAARA